MSRWPQMCVRCGEKDPAKLTVQKFKWQHMISQIKGVGSTTSEYAYLHAKIAICHRCRKIGIIRFWVSLGLSFIALLFGFAWTFGAFGGIQLLGLVLLVPAVGLFMFLILLRRQVSRFYAHFYYSAGYIRGFFRNKEYKRAFDAAFPGGFYVHN